MRKLGKAGKRQAIRMARLSRRDLDQRTIRMARRSNCKSAHSARAGKHLEAIEVLQQALAEPSAVPYARSLLGVAFLKSG